MCLGLFDCIRGEPTNHYIENRSQEQPEKGHPKHAEEDGRA